MSYGAAVTELAHRLAQAAVDAGVDRVSDPADSAYHHLRHLAREHGVRFEPADGDWLCTAYRAKLVELLGIDWLGQCDGCGLTWPRCSCEVPK